MGSGYFISDTDKGSIIKSSNNSQSQKILQTTASAPSVKHKFFEIIPAIVIGIDLSNNGGKIKVRKLLGDDVRIQEAYPINNYNRIVPLIGEIVLVSEYFPSDIYEISEKLQEFSGDLSKYNNLYYHSILNTKNNIHLNEKYKFLSDAELLTIESINTLDNYYGYVYPFITKNSHQNLITNKFEHFVNNKSKSLLNLEGDILFQGRSGQSIRFTQSLKLNTEFIINDDITGSAKTVESLNRKNTSWLYGKEGGMPITIISNGRKKTDNINLGKGLKNITIEDINTDDASIYLSSENILPIKISSIIPSFLLRNKEYPENFSGKQILITSDRILLNSKENEMFLFAKKYISLSSKKIVVKASEIVTIESPIIELGDNASNQQVGEPTVKARQLQIILDDILSLIQNFIDPTNPSVILKLEQVRNSLKQIESTNTYVL